MRILGTLAALLALIAASTVPPARRTEAAILGQAFHISGRADELGPQLRAQTRRLRTAAPHDTGIRGEQTMRVCP